MVGEVWFAGCWGVVVVSIVESAGCRVQNAMCRVRRSTKCIVLSGAMHSVVCADYAVCMVRCAKYVMCRILSIWCALQCVECGGGSLQSA